MSDQEKVETLIDIAITHGWKDEHCTYQSTKDWVRSGDEQYGNLLDAFSIESLLFDHAFAKTVYGIQFEDDEDKNDDTRYWGGFEFEYKGTRWQYHLQMQVLSFSPIEYMYDHRRKV